MVWNLLQVVHLSAAEDSTNGTLLLINTKNILQNLGDVDLSETVKMFNFFSRVVAQNRVRVATCSPAAGFTEYRIEFDIKSCPPQLG